MKPAREGSIRPATTISPPPSLLLPLPVSPLYTHSLLPRQRQRSVRLGGVEGWAGARGERGHRGAIFSDLILFYLILFHFIFDTLVDNRRGPSQVPLPLQAPDLRVDAERRRPAPRAPPPARVARPLVPRQARVRSRKRQARLGSPAPARPEPGGRRRAPREPGGGECVQRGRGMTGAWSHSTRRVVPRRGLQRAHLGMPFEPLAAGESAAGGHCPPPFVLSGHAASLTPY